MEKPGGHIGGSESHHFLIRVNFCTQTGRVGTRKNARIGERYQGNRTPPDQNRDDIARGNPRNREGRETLWEGTEHRHVRTGREVEHTNDYRRANYSNKCSRKARAVLEQQNYRQRAGANRKCRPVRFSIQNELANGPQFPQRAGVLDREAEKLGTWLISTVSAIPFMYP